MLRASRPRGEAGQAPKANAAGKGEGACAPPFARDWLITVKKVKCALCGVSSGSFIELFLTSAHYSSMFRLIFMTVIFFASVSYSAEKSIDELWADFDPHRDPLEIEILKDWNEGQSHYREFFFTGLTHEGEKVRVYAIYGAPMGAKKVPATLHIHGGGQTAYQPWAKFWSERGYACLTFNWGGVWPNREKYTHWGKLREANHQYVGKLVQATEPSAKISSWYLWTLVSMRALTALEAQPEVDPKKLGIFGISMGGTIVWPFAALDKRVKAACAIYGAGWNTYPETLDLPDKPDQATIDWRRLMDSEAYAPLVQCPILFLNGSNDQHGKMDFCQKTLDLTRAPHRQAITARYRHHIAADEGINLSLWMDHYLKGEGPEWPKSPELKFANKSMPELELRPDKLKEVSRVEIYYALDNANPKNRFWRTAKAEKTSEGWMAQAPVLSSTTNFYAFANVYYQNGICLSSDLIRQRLNPKQATPRAEETSLLIDDFSNGIQSWASSSPGTDPLPPIRKIIQATNGPAGLPGMTTTLSIALFTHKIGDPQWKAPEGAKLSMSAYSTINRPVHVVVHEKEFAIGWKPYTNIVNLVGQPDWQTFTIEMSDFVGKDGALKSWADVNMLELVSPDKTNPQPTYGRFEWKR